MERVFAKYDNIKNVFEDLLNEESGKFRKLFSDGVIYIFDAENVNDDKDFISHGLNVGIYNDSNKVESMDYLNIVLIDNKLNAELIRQQILFFTCTKGSMIDVAFSLNKENYNEFKKNIDDLRKIEIVLNKVHDHQAPIRKHDYKNIKIYSKYLVGESVGGDYFDVEEVNRRLYLFLVSFNSYVSSVNFMKGAELLKKGDDSSFKHVCEYIEKHRDGIKSAVFMEIDTRKLAAKYYKSGEVYFSMNNLRGEVGDFDLKLGDVINMGSFGFYHLTKNYESVSSDNYRDEDKIKDMYNDFFSFLNAKKKGRFLSDDSTLVSLVVSKSAIKEV